MPVELTLKDIQIDIDSRGSYTPTPTTATIVIKITENPSNDLEMNFKIVGFSSIDVAIDQARQRLLTFAQELQAAAFRPFVGSPINQ